MSGTINAAAVVVTSNATLTASSAAFGGLLTVQNGATVRMTGGTLSLRTNGMAAVRGRGEMRPSTTVNVSGTVTSRGTLRWVTENNRFILQGSGRVENEGLWEAFADTVLNGVEGLVDVPVNVPVGGKLLLSTNALVDFRAGSSLTVAGELEIQSGARLRLDSGNPARDLVLLAGAQVSGAGTLRLEGGCRL